MAERQRREAYVKMTIERVRLVPEEAVLGGCKTIGNTTGPSGNGCGIGGTPCHLDGS
jgi:hypothetical protein